MIKLKATKKEIREHYNTIINVDYCGIQFLLKGKSAFAYACGNLGWKCDFYEFDNICICTGYDTMHSKAHPTISYKLCQKYDNLARPITDNKELDKLLTEFIKEAINEMKGGKNGTKN